VTLDVKGNQTQAARILGDNRVTVWNRKKKYGIDLKKVTVSQSSYTGRAGTKQGKWKQIMGDEFIGYQEALKQTLKHITPLGAKEIPLADGATHLSAKDAYSLVDSPSVDTSLKDGFAVRSEEIADASPEIPVKLQVLDVAAAGIPSTGKVQPGTAIRVLPVQAQMGIGEE